MNQIGCTFGKQDTGKGRQFIFNAQSTMMVIISVLTEIDFV